MVLLEVNNLEKRFGGLTALAGYHLTLESGELTGLIGPNGAGKTTVFNLLSGVLRPDRGSIRIGGADATGLRPDQAFALGIARTFQNIRLFADLTVTENIQVAFHKRHGRGFWATMLHTPGFRRSEKEMFDRAEEFLALMNLTDVRNEPAHNLPYGLQRRVEIARALAGEPRLLLLDEPAAGMNASESEDLVRTIGLIHERYGLTILLVEHDMSVVMAICRRIQVLDRGTVLAEGDPSAIRHNPKVVEAYLGAPRTESC